MSKEDQIANKIKQCKETIQSFADKIKGMEERKRETEIYLKALQDTLRMLSKSK